MSKVESTDVIHIDGLSKSYRRTASGHKLRTLKSALMERSLISSLTEAESIRALSDISFSVGRGEAVGLIGSNGAGKSTLLKLIAGILLPTAGSVQIAGRVAALIELGAGFHPEISGRENIYINGAVLGLSRRQIDERFADIVAFSGLEDFIEEPVKNYSSGMYVRLGFAVAIHTDPDVLLVDEVLAVGDESFAHRCLRRIQEILARGKTLVLVSHSLALIEEVCDRAIWLDRGVMRLDGHPRRVVDAYRQAVAEEEGRLHRDAKESREQELAEQAAAVAEEEESTAEVAEEQAEAPEPEEVLRWGSGAARIEAVRLWVNSVSGDGAGEWQERYLLASGDRVRLEFSIKSQEEIEDFVFGVAISTPRGVECWGTNTDMAGYSPARLPPGQSTVQVECAELNLGPGEYLVDVAVHAKDGTPYDYRRKLLAFSVTASVGGVGVYFPKHEWTFSEGIEWNGDGIAQGRSSRE